MRTAAQSCRRNVVRHTHYVKGAYALQQSSVPLSREYLGNDGDEEHKWQRRHS
jgi:hypothetical protein